VGATASPAQPQAAQPDVAGVSAAQRKHRHARTERVLDPAAAEDRFLDVIVLLSVLVFVVMVTGFGMLVLQGAL
jgi:hypothetical protein